jgi:aryl-alcohol dehydrogenase-like predicted oxidoreductase
MKYRKLGKTGILVSEIGFGAWGIGGSHGGAVAYGKTDDAESLLALKTAFGLGVNFYDTADIYGFGHSEELIGKAFAGCRADVIIASKVGFLGFDGKQDFSPQYINGSIENSLKSLHTDYIDLYQLHSPDVGLIEDNTLGALYSLKKQGKIREIGISVRSPDDGIIAINHFEFKVIQVNFNILDQRILDNGLLELCGKKNIGVIIRTPLCFGFLTGKYAAADIFREGDHRSRWSKEQIGKWVDEGKSIMGNVIAKGMFTDAQVALRFCLSYRDVSTVIPGMLGKEQVEENCLTSSV